MEKDNKEIMEELKNKLSNVEKQYNSVYTTLSEFQKYVLDNAEQFATVNEKEEEEFEFLIFKMNKRITEINDKIQKLIIV